MKKKGFVVFLPFFPSTVLYVSVGLRITVQLPQITGLTSTERLCIPGRIV